MAKTNQNTRAAIYARVSSEQQEKEGTIESQLRLSDNPVFENPLIAPQASRRLLCWPFTNERLAVDCFFPFCMAFSLAPSDSMFDLSSGTAR